GEGAAGLVPGLDALRHQLIFTMPPLTSSMPPPSTVPLALALLSTIVPSLLTFTLALLVTLSPWLVRSAPALLVSPALASLVRSAPALLVSAADDSLVKAPVDFALHVESVLMSIFPVTVMVRSPVTSSL